MRVSKVVQRSYRVSLTFSYRMCLCFYAAYHLEKEGLLTLRNRKLATCTLSSWKTDSKFNGPFLLFSNSFDLSNFFMFCCYFAYLRISETIYLLQGEQGERGPEGNVGPPGFQVWFIQYSDIYANAFGEENRLINTVLLNLGILYLFT